MSCPLFTTPPTLKGASRTRPCRVDNFVNVFCVARLLENIVKQMVFHYFSIWVGHRIFRRIWPILQPLASLLGVWGWLSRLSEALGHAGPAQQGQGNPCWRSWSALLALLGRPISRFGASLGRCRLHARIWDRFKRLLWPNCLPLSTKKAYKC